jgi:hypothetical protein
VARVPVARVPEARVPVARVCVSHIHLLYKPTGFSPYSTITSGSMKPFLPCILW